MSNYERALKVAREASVSVPEFEAIAAASDREREVWTAEGHEARARARRWLWVAAASWLSVSLLQALDQSDLGISYHVATSLTPALLLIWAARLSRDRRLRPAILSRAIAASNLVLASAVLFFHDDLGWSLVSTFVLAIATGRSLQLLGERDLDGSGDPASSFEPVQFRGVLILALVLACADALTLLYAGLGTLVGMVWAYWFGGYDVFSSWWPHIGMSAGAAALMAVNVWGLLRLRTWALLSNMAANVAIAALALTGMLVTSDALSKALVVTAGIQLLLPLPILAAALGYGKTIRYERVGPVLLRVVVPALMLAATLVTGLVLCRAT